MAGRAGGAASGGGFGAAAASAVVPVGSMQWLIEVWFQIQCPFFVSSLIFIVIVVVVVVAAAISCFCRRPVLLFRVQTIFCCQPSCVRVLMVGFVLKSQGRSLSVLALVLKVSVGSRPSDRS